MSPATIIREAAGDGVNLSLSEAETIKAAGDQAAVNRWLPAIRAHKAFIVVLLVDAAVRRWLAAIGETDQETIDEVLAACRRDSEVRAYFLGRARNAGMDAHSSAGKVVDTTC
ncbi:hypothetical protein E4Q23_08995 [Candidatus Accumulibacter phosphatis]|jgi:hypothetical protein|uniref:Uncharacterized protein n=1 Tax=Candidatus Accumulibacter phosphatis TaxID=327160 RepID=A0ABX1TUD0_9PROT|nr:hypothetical protein [Candidatus Accumulibacter phosphatis]NMQ27882.1 hypothetical protein [Candidatus Accumulibacter phosphatis]